MNNSALVVTLLLFYSAFLVGLGLVISRAVRTAGDFFVAGRKLGAGVLFSTVLAANIGAGSTVGAAGLGYAYGLSAWWWVGSAGLGSLVLAFAVGPRIHALATRHGFLTLGDYLEHRYNRNVRLLYGGVLWFGSLAILAGQLIAVAWILHGVAGVPKAWGCLLAGTVVTLYFTAGGLLSAAWVNVIQLAVKMTGFAIAVPWALASLGGWDGLRVQAGSNLASLRAASDYFDIAGVGVAGVLAWVVILVPSFFVSPGLIQKAYGARSGSTVRWAIGLQSGVLLLYSFLPVVLGMVAFAAYPGLDNRELALPTVLVSLLPVWLGALLLAAVFSAEVSSADAVLFMLSTSVAKDFYKSLRKPDATDAELLRVTRWAAAGAGVAGTLAAIGLPSVIAALTIFYGLLAVVLTVPLMAGLYWRAADARSAVIAMVTGAGATAAVYAMTAGKGWGVLNPFASGILAAAAALIFSVFVQKKEATEPQSYT